MCFMLNVMINNHIEQSLMLRLESDCPYRGFQSCHAETKKQSENNADKTKTKTDTSQQHDSKTKKYRVNIISSHLLNSFE